MNKTNKAINKIIDNITLNDTVELSYWKKPDTIYTPEEEQWLDFHKDCDIATEYEQGQENEIRVIKYCDTDHKDIHIEAEEYARLNFDVPLNE